MNNNVLVFVLIVVSMTVFLSSLLVAFYRKTRYLNIFCNSLACYFLSYLLLAFQNQNNLFLSTVISTILMVSGYLLLFSSVRAFYLSKLVWPKRFWVYLALSVAIPYTTTILHYNVILRNIVLGILTFIIFIDFGLYIYGKFNRMSPIVKSAIVISLLVNTITNTIRPVIMLMVLSPQDLPMKNDVLSMFFFFSFAVTSIFWFTTFILMDGSMMLNETKISEEKYRSLIDSTDAAITLIDSQGCFLYLNAIAAFPYGKKQEEMVGINVRDIFPPDQAVSILSDIEKVLSSKQGFTKETIAEIAGETLYCRTSTQPVLDESGKPYAALISSTDISDMRKIQEQVEQSEKNYRTMFFESPEGNLLIKDNRIIECNKAAVNLLGGQGSQIIGMSIADISPEYQPNGKKSEESAEEILWNTGQDERKSFEWVHKRFDGTEIIVLVSLNTILYDGQQVLLSTWRDITAQRKAEEGLRKLSTAVEQSPVSIVIANVDGLIEYANPKASATTGYSLEELIGNNPRILQSGYTSDDEYAKLWEKISQGFEWRGIFYNKRKNGEMYWESSVISPVFDACENITNFIAIKEDITERKKTEEALIINQKRLEQVTELSRTVIWEMDTEGRYTYINDVCEVVYGFSSIELIDTYHHKIVMPNLNSTESSKETGLDILKSGLSLNNYERQIRRKDGTTIWVSTSAAPIFDKDNNIIGFMGADNDITARKAAEEETRKFRTIADQANYGVAICNMEVELIYVNDTYARMHGFEQKELLHKKSSLLFNTEQKKRIDSLYEIATNTHDGFAAEEIWAY